MKMHLIIFLLMAFGGYQKVKAQYPEFIIREVHAKLEWVPEEEMKHQPGYSFKQKGYKGGDFDPHFTSVMLWIQPIRSYPWTEKAHLKFLHDLKQDTFTEFVRNFAMDTRNKQLKGMDPKKFQQVELGNPEKVHIMGFPGIQFVYKYTNEDQKLLNNVKKNRFTARRVLLFMDRYIAEITWEYVPDENDWNKVVLEQLSTIQVK
jgi:hypothetical protein